jgi:AraC family transcriptional regulator of adaptative response/methylated-DNA-[protein]-cysteine methyltransferase
VFSDRGNPIVASDTLATTTSPPFSMNASDEHRDRNSQRHAQDAERVTAACRFIEQSASMPPLKALARHAGISPYHFHRLFKAVTGVTPHQYAQTHRTKRLQQALAEGGRVTDAILDAGFNTGSRFYEKSAGMLGMTARELRRGGAHIDIHFAIGDCRLGALLVAQSARGICAILLGDEPDALARELQDRFPNANLLGGDAGFEATVAQVIAFVDEPARGLALPLDIRGTAFQQRVWQALREIPPGKTVSYSRLAEILGLPKSARAVAQACAANRIAVAIPCHRVVRNDGAISGYRWGVERKRALLDNEAASLATRPA